MQRFQAGHSLCAGRFEIQSRLGLGGSGEVYLARDLQSAGQKLVALKIYAELSAGDSPLLEVHARIHREAEALSKIKSEAIVKAFEFVSDSNMTILVQEYLPGGSLQDAIRLEPKEYRKPKTWLRIALALANGLDTVHAAGLIHGDIKPANIGFRDFAHKQPVFLDFGQAAFVNSKGFLTRSTQAMGTLPYLAPERTGFIKSSREEQSDLYSLGATLYEIATGRPPFQEANPKSLLEKILNGVASPLSHEVDGFPELLSDIVQKLLRKNPNDRYFTARGVARDLEMCLQSIEENGTLQPFALGKNDRFRELNNNSTFIGRKNEVEKLKKQLSATLAGRGGCAFIGAPSGAGKSRLCHQVGIEASEKNVLTLVGKFSEFERNLPLSGILAVIHSFFREIKLEQPEELAFWAKRTGEKLGTKLNILTQRLTFLDEVFAAANGYYKQEFEDEQRVFAEALVELLVQMGSRNEAMILILDDLQWADSESMAVVELISELARQGELGKMLMLGCYRSNEVNQEHPLHMRVLQFEGGQAHIQLGPLSEEESDQLVEHLLDERGAEVTRLQRMSYLLTQGNPFYVREYLSFCLSREIFRPDESGENWIFDSAKAQNASLSFGIASLVSERINELKEESKQILLVASAVGNEVELSAIDSMLHQKQIATPLLRSLSELSEKHLIYFSRDKLIFVHDKVREAAYQLAGKDLRTDCHHNYAIWLYRKIEDSEGSHKQRNTSNELFELAYHLKNGWPDRDPVWARGIFLEAGRLALKVFAYRRALEYAQTAHQLLPQDSSTSPVHLSEFVQTSEILADALALNEDPLGAVEIYSNLVSSVEDQVHRSEILAKLCDCNLTLFRYRESISAAEQGMRSLGRYINTNELTGLLGILLMLVPFSIGVLLWPFFGKQSRTIESRHEQVFFKLLVSMQVALFFSRPVCAINNQMIYTFRFLRLKPNEYRAILVGYWAVASATFGFAKISAPLFKKSLQYFEQHPDPIFRSFLLFTQGYLNDFPRGRVREAHAKHVQALEILENAGESFWRVLTMQGLIQMDEYALANGESYALHSKYTNLIIRIKQTPTILDAVLRHHLLTKNTSELNRLESIVKEAAASNRTDGYDPVDRCYANISLGEINLLREDPQTALPYLKEAFSSISKHFHRIFYCIFAPALLASCYIRLNRPIAAILPLTVAWINQIFSARLLLPKTIFITGEMFYRSGLRVIGRWLTQIGISKAQQLRLPAIQFELRLYLAHLLAEDDPDFAHVLYRMCREYFSERQYLYFVDRCDRGILQTEAIAEQRQSYLQTSGQTASHNTKTEFLRPKVELELLLQVFLNLSALNEKEPLLDAVLDVMCQCTGVDFGVLFIYENQKLTPVRARGCSLDDLKMSLNPAWGVDKWFLEKCEQEGKRDPRIRPRAWRIPHPACDGSAMIVPLSFKDNIYGYCYLANAEVNDFFDGRSQQLVSPLASQAAIAYQNFILMSSKEDKARLDAELSAARAVQDALLPTAIEVPCMLISYFYEPASETGGDWFHHHFDPIRNRLFVVVGDVTGHGLSSSLLTAVVSGAVQSHLQKELKRSHEGIVSIEESLIELAKVANAAVFSTGSRSNRFMTMCFVCLDLESGEMGIVSAGHTPPYILNASEKRVSTLPCSGTLLGFSNIPRFEYTSYMLSAGDSVLLYTDGLLENTTSLGPVLTARSLRKTMNQAESPINCIEILSEIVKKAAKEQPLDDDVTIYMFCWNGSNSVELANVG